MNDFYGPVLYGRSPLGGYTASGRQEIKKGYEPRVYVIRDDELRETTL